MPACLAGSKNLPNLLETDEPPATSSASAATAAQNNTGSSASVALRRPLSTMNELAIGGRQLVGEVQAWWANCLRHDDEP